MRPNAYLVACCVSLAALTGCESLQRKFTRKPKHPAGRPSPIIQFQDYGRAMTPMDRYRKHYLMFDYWNHELLDGLQGRPLNAKAYRKASEESLAELEILKTLLKDEPAGRLAPFIENRARIVKRLSGAFSDLQADTVIRDIEAQARALHRGFAPSDVQDVLKEEAAATEAPHSEAVRPPADDARSD